MILNPAIAFQRGRRSSRYVSIPASTGGLNAVDAWSAMPSRDAILLDNFFPETNAIKIRRGYTSYSAGHVDPIHSLMEWSGPVGKKLFLATPTTIKEVAYTVGIGGTPNVTGMTNGQWQHTMMATSGGNFLVIANGADSVRHQDGTSGAWVVPTITGVTSSTLINLFVHKRRLWFIEKNTLNTWYLPVDSIAGAATKIDLGPVFALGGKLVAGGSMTRDGGAGPDDLACFLTDRGEVAVYQGTDPASASTWAIVGVFQISPPIGLRCTQKLGGDLSIITEGGVISLMAMFALDRSAQDKAAITNKINRLFREDAELYKANFGWQSISYPRGNMVIVNVPNTTNKRQYVMNATTGAWCRFNHPALCWSLFAEDLYFGDSSGTVWKADSGGKDAGVNVSAYLQTAFNYFGNSGEKKQVLMVRPRYESAAGSRLEVGINTDFVINAVPKGINTIRPGQWVTSSAIGNAVSIELGAVDPGFAGPIPVRIHGFDVVLGGGQLL